MICFITGGARSGKSTYAQKSALALSNQPVYVATSNVRGNDTEFAARVQRHQQERDERWTTYEEPMHMIQLPLSGRVVVIDCVTLWLTNFFSVYKNDVDLCLSAMQKEIDHFTTLDATIYIVSNELGMGLHATTEVGRKFTDLQGWANQYIAQKADKVVLMISGIPLIIKEHLSLKKQ
jgi:adenosylcobinamide kinase / adenosylcobinamide-phosphate guanylyltransferase